MKITQELFFLEYQIQGKIIETRKKPKYTCPHLLDFTQVFYVAKIQFPKKKKKRRNILD